MPVAAAPTEEDRRRCAPAVSVSIGLAYIA